MKEYTIRLTDYLYKDDYGKIRCVFCKCWIRLRTGYCERCMEGYEKRNEKTL